MPTYTGTSAGDTFVAPTDEDWIIIGKGGGDTLTGAGGNDTFYGGLGNDVLNGGDGDDVFVVGLKEGADNYTGGVGYDVIRASANNVAIGISSISGIEEISADVYAPVTIIGTSGNDVLDFTNVKLTNITSINGGGGNDTIYGSVDNDTINGGAGNDTLYGGGGDDTFSVGYQSGFDKIDGGIGTNQVVALGNNVQIGIDTIANIQTISGNGFDNVRIVTAAGAGRIYDFSAITLDGVTGITLGNGGQTLTASAGDDNILGGSGNDTIYGGEGSDTINGGGGVDKLYGQGGDDIFVVTGGGTTFYGGGTGYDTISGGKDNAVITLTTNSILSIEEINSGGFGNVTIAGTAGADNINLSGVLINEGEIAAINAGDGNDIVRGTKLADVINGGNGDDTIYGNSGLDLLNGGAGNDYLDGGAGDDEIHGGNGNDTIVGGLGNDLMYGDAGDDVFLVSGSGGLDSYDGGAGIDTIKAATNGAKIGIAAIAGIEIITADGHSNVTIVGSADPDTLDFTNIQLIGIKSINAGASGDTITGSAGGDTIIGLGGDDVLNGGGGSDVITGGLGLDILTGGTGADIFKDGIKNFTGDTITDFSAEDKLDFTNISNPSAVTFAFSNNTLTVDPDGAGALKAFSFTLTGDFNAAGFHASSDGAGGTFVSYIA